MQMGFTYDEYWRFFKECHKDNAQVILNIPEGEAEWLIKSLKEGRKAQDYLNTLYVEERFNG